MEDRFGTRTAHDPSAAKLGQVLQGDLAEKPIAYLLSIAHHYDATGHLHIGPPGCRVTVQFGLGKPVSAISPFAKGSEVIFDLFTWKHGSVIFEDGKQPDIVNLDETPEKLVQSGETYAQDCEFLERNLINEQSILLRGPKLSSDEMNRVMRSCPTVSGGVLADIFSSVYGTLNLIDVAEKLSLRRSQWVMAVSHLLRGGALIAPNGKSLKVTEPLPLSFKDNASIVAPAFTPTSQTTSDNLSAETADSIASITTDAIRPITSENTGSITLDSIRPITTETIRLGALMVSIGLPPSPVSLKLKAGKSSLPLLNNADTGILRHDVLEYLLESEFSRAARFGTNLTLVVFCLIAHGYGATSMPIEKLLQIIHQIDNLRREVDIFGHFGDRAYALLLPNVLPDQAGVLVDRISSELQPVLATPGQPRLTMHFGMAAAPQDATEVSALSLGAQQAMKASADAGVLKTTFSQMPQ